MDKEENFSSHVVDLVKAKIILSELIGKDVHLQKKGEDFWGLCPFHNEKSASFTVSDQKGFYHCFGCGVHGDAISYIMSRQNVDFKESLKILSEQYGVALYKIKSKEQFQAFQQEKEKKEILLEIMEKAAEYFQKSLKNNKNSDMARKYLKSRGVSVESIDNFRIGYCDGTCASYLKDLGYSFELINEAGLIYGAEENFKNKFNNRIIFPIFNTNNKVIAFGGRLIKISQNAPKYLNSPETPIFHKGSNLFNLNFARTFTKKTSLIVVEGYMDVVMMVQNGFPQTVASLGTALTEDQISTAWRYSVHPILCFDGDAAGIMASRRAALRTLPILDSGKTLFFCYLPGELDPDEFLQEQGKDAMKGQLEKAVPLSDVIWNSLLTKYQKTANSSLLPEDQAALKKEIFDVTRLIKNPEIKKGYDSLLLGKFFSFLRKDRFFSKNPLKTSFYLKNLKFKQKSTLPQKILLGILLKVPILLLELDEFLLRIDFSDREFREIKDWLLSMHFSQADFEDDQTKRQLEVFLEKIGMNMLKTHASFLFDENVTTNDIIARWRDIWLQSIESGAVKEDLTYMSGLLKKNLNKDLWGKLKLLSNNKSNKDL